MLFKIQLDEPKTEKLNNVREPFYERKSSYRWRCFNKVSVSTRKRKAVFVAPLKLNLDSDFEVTH